MATITVIESSDRFEPETRTIINDNFEALNTELATMLPKAGGTMSGALNMNGENITNLPTPTASGHPARKAEYDNTVQLTGNQTIAGTKTFSTTPVVPDASWGRVQMAAGRRKIMIACGTIKQTTQFLQVGDIATASATGLAYSKAGCVTDVVFVDSSGNVLNATQAYASSGSASAGRFAATSDKVTVHRSTSTGQLNVKINGTNVSGLSLAGSETEDYQVTLWAELDD